MTLQDRCIKIWKEDNISDDKINWLLQQLTQEAIDNNHLITDEQIKNAKCRLIWYGLGEAVLNYIAWESKQI